VPVQQITRYQQLKEGDSVAAVTKAMPAPAPLESVVGTAGDYLSDEPDSEVKHLTIRLEKARALQFMHCFAANFRFGSEAAVYIGLHEPAANIPIEMRIPVDRDHRFRLIPIIHSV
jgi:hypothetical protein